MRTCFVCKASDHRKNLLRFVGRPGQVLAFDIKQTLPGRGMWVHADGNCLKQAIDKRLFFKAAKGTVQIPDHFFESIQTQRELFSNKLNSDHKEV